MKLESFFGGTPPVARQALCFGHQKISQHVKGRGFEPKAHTLVPGALDFHFIVSGSLNEVIERLNAMHIHIVEGPVSRTGATSKLRSVYVRDTDLNLIELAEPPF